jgi:hypothetical protein
MAKNSIDSKNPVRPTKIVLKPDRTQSGMIIIYLLFFLYNRNKPAANPNDCIRDKLTPSHDDKPNARYKYSTSKFAVYIIKESNRYLKFGFQKPYINIIDCSDVPINRENKKVERLEYLLASK